MDRTERLLDLVALFLDAKDPITMEELREAFPEEYGGPRENSQRKWERDKQELLELGVPITFVNAVDDKPAGYVTNKEAYYLPELGLSADELAVLYAAGSAVLASGAFPGRQDLAHALRKVGFFADGPLPAPAVRLDLGDTSQLAGRLDVLWDAITARKSVELDYFSPHRGEATTRKVNPYGLALRRVSGAADRALGAAAEDLERLFLRQRPLDGSFDIVRIAGFEKVGHAAPSRPLGGPVERRRERGGHVRRSPRGGHLSARLRPASPPTLCRRVNE